MFICWMQDLHSVDLEEFKYGGTNITALRLVDPEKPEMQKVVRDWASSEQRQGRKSELSTHHLSVREQLNRHIKTAKYLCNGS